MNAKNHDRKSRDSHPDVEALLRKLPMEEAAQLRDLWELVGHEEPAPGPSSEDVDAAFEQLLTRVEAEGHPVTMRAANRPDRRADRKGRGAVAGTRRRWVGWATLAAAVLIGGLSLFWWLRPVTQAAMPGEQLTVTLPDGSQVELNSGSRLQYARRFGDARTVQLTGEAFFDVVDDDRPFVVETFNAQVRVPGTRFGVRAWPGGLDDGTTVALEQGRVIVAPIQHPDQAAEMVPGETRRVSVRPEPPRVLTEVSVDDATAWLWGDLVFKNQPLGVVLDDVGRRYAVDIEVHPQRLTRTRLNLALRQPKSVEAVIHDLALALDLEYRETSTGFTLFNADAAANLDA